MHLLPLHLARIADAADLKNSTRFALSAVHLRLPTPGTFVIESTDSKRLIRISGECQHKADDYPAHASLDAAAEDPKKKTFLVPAEVWKRSFTMAGKLKSRDAINKTLAVKLGKDTATFAATNLDSYPVESTREIEGRYPPTDDIVKQTKKNTKFCFAVDPMLLADTLKAISSMQGDDNKRVEFHVGKENTPIRILGRGANGEEIEAFVMPLAGEPDTPAAKASKKAYDKAAKEQEEKAMTPAEPLPKLDEDQRREPDLDPHACVTCREVDCICEPVAEGTDLEADDTETETAQPLHTCPIVVADSEPVQSFTMEVRS